MTAPALTRFLLLSAALATAAPVSAREKAAPPPPPAASDNPLEMGGTPIPGLCFFSEAVLIRDSKAGQSAVARLKVLSDQAQTEVGSDEAALRKAAQDFAAQRAKLPPATAQQRQAALVNQRQALEQKVQVRNNELALTRRRALARVTLAADPDIRAAYKARGCGALLGREVLVGANMSNDITALVVAALDTHLATVTFEREKLGTGGQPDGQ